MMSESHIAWYLVGLMSQYGHEVAGTPPAYTTDPVHGPYTWDDIRDGFAGTLSKETPHVYQYPVFVHKQDNFDIDLVIVEDIFVRRETEAMRILAASASFLHNMYTCILSAHDRIGGDAAP